MREAIRPWNALSSLFVVVCVLTGVAGCSTSQWSKSAQEVQAIASPSAPTGSMASDSTVLAVRPLAQGVAAATPWGGSALAIIAGLAGLATAVIQTFQKTKVQSKLNSASSAIKEITPLLPAEKVSALSKSTTRTVLEHTT